jgi:hypothetical protein
MIANLAAFRNTHGRPQHQVPVVNRPCNDNHPVSHLVAAPRRARDVLARRWRTTPAGTLECVWHVQPVRES